MKKILIGGLIILGTTACSGTGTTLNNTQKGAILGGLAGAVIGKSTSNHDNKRVVIGGAVGAGVGAAIGAYMDKQEEALRQTVAGTGIEVNRQGDNIMLSMPDSITFDSARSDIKPQFYAVLNSLANTLVQYDQTTIQIAGHTDSRGSAEYNQKLSVQRANSVKNYLGQQRVAANRMIPIGYGESRPIADNASTIGQAQNRRVEITLVPIQQQG